MTTESIKIIEVGPRDGLQNEPETVPTETKVELINRLSDTGLKAIEVGAFVSPKWVPQMADTAEVFKTITKKPGVSYPCLVPNEKGLDAALAAGVREIAIFAAASEGFSQKNINCSIAESLERFKPVCEQALAENIKVRGYISCALACPYDGDTAPADVARVAKALKEMGCYEISLGDTIGIGTPDKTRAMLHAVKSELPTTALAGHFHDTYGHALDNIRVSLDEGLTTFDSSVGGLGGCPYAKGATGNVATERVLDLLHGLGLKTGIDTARIRETSDFIHKALKKNA